MKDIFYRNKRISYLNILLFIVAFSLPFSLAFNSISVILLFLFSLSSFKLKYIKVLLSYKQIYLYFIVFYLFQIISFLYSFNKNLALDNLVRNSVYLVLPITFLGIRIYLNKHSFRALFYGLLLSVTLSMVKIYGHLFKNLFFSSFQLKDYLREGFVENGIYNIHVPYFSLLVILLIIYSMKFQFSKNFKWNLCVKVSLLLLLTCSLLLLSGLMSVLILFLFFIYLFIKSSLKNYLKIIFIFFMVGSITITSFVLKNMEQIERVRGAENIFFRIQNLMNSDSNVRIDNWESVTMVISENFFFGVGVDGGLEELLKKRKPLTEPFVNKHNAHNVYLETMLRYGLFGFIIFSLIVYQLIKEAINSKNYYYNWFLVTFLISSLTESYLQRQIGIVFFVFISLFFYTLKTNKYK